MAWTKEQIKSLRLRMGWEQADLARRLNCHTQIVIQWEQGELDLEEKYTSTLEMLNTQAESNAIEVSSAPMMEIILEDTHTNQISISEVHDKQS